MFERRDRPERWFAVRQQESRLSKAYWRLLLATGIDNVGDGAYIAAIPLLAITVTKDPRLITLISTATYLPWLLVSLPAGTLVDRIDRVSLMRRSQVAAAVIVTGTALLVVFDQVNIAILAVMAFALGTCDVFFGNAAQAVLPDIVPANLLHKANGNQQAVTIVGQSFVGPPVGSALFAVSAALPFGVDACSFVLSASVLSALPKGPRRPSQPMRTAIANGLQWLMRHRLLRTLAILLGVNTFCWHMSNATLVLFATETLHVGTRAYGVLLASAALGGVLGGLVNARLVNRVGPIPALLGALVTSFLAFLGAGFSPNAYTLGAFMAINGFAITLWNIVTMTLRQQLVPPDMLGRVNSVYRMLGWGLIPLGTLAGGLVAHDLGLRAPYQIAALLRALAILAALRTILTAKGDSTAHT